MTTDDLWWGLVQKVYLRDFNKKGKILSPIAFSALIKNWSLFKMEETPFFQKIKAHFSKENEKKIYLQGVKSEALRIRCGFGINLLNLILLTSFI